MKKLILAAAFAASAFHPAAHALLIGDFGFTSFNSQEDGWALVAFVDVPANSILYFTDNEATNPTTFNAGESYHAWNTGGSLIAAGTVIRFSAVDNATTLAASIGTFTRATVSGNSNYGLSTSSDTVYLFEGTPAAPTTILTDVSSSAASETTLAGLTNGINAVILPAATLFSQYNGPRSGLNSFAAYRPLVNDASNWTASVSNAAAVPDTTAFTVVPEPSVGVSLIGGMALLIGLRRSRRFAF